VKRFAFMRENRHWPLRRMCRMLNVSGGGFYNWLKRRPCAGKVKRMRMVERISEVFDQSRGSYGSPRVQAQLAAEGESINVKTVAKLMKQAGIAVKPARAFVPQTTQSDATDQRFENRLDRQFDAALPNQKWVGDITYLATAQGWMYLAVILDLCSRRVVGWSTSDHLKTELVSEALANAITQRRPGKGLLHHSDRGCQYTSENYQRLLNQMQMEVSMSDPSQCWDNAVAESFFRTLKIEWTNQQSYATHEQAHASLFEWIECWYNRKRLHSSLGYQSPETFEAQFN
jgi:putative transposase